MRSPGSPPDSPAALIARVAQKGMAQRSDGASFEAAIVFGRLRRVRETGAERAASRVFVGVDCRLIRFLRRAARPAGGGDLARRKAYPQGSKMSGMAGLHWGAMMDQVDGLRGLRDPLARASDLDARLDRRPDSESLVAIHCCRAYSTRKSASAAAAGVGGR